MLAHYLTTQWIHVTAQYSNAVLVAIMPHISDFCQKVDLPVPMPVTMNQVAKFGCYADRNNPGGNVLLTNDCRFVFQDGCVVVFVDYQHSFRNSRSEWRSELYGPTNMSKDEAVAFARGAIRKLGYLEADLFMDGKPRVHEPHKDYTGNFVPYYDIEWTDPNGHLVCTFEIDGQHRMLTAMDFASSATRKAPPKIAVEPEELAPDEVPDFASRIPEVANDFKSRPLEHKITPQETAEMLQGMLPGVSECARKLNLPIEQPITTNSVELFDAKDQRVYLTNGYEFKFRGGRVEMFKAPLAYFAGRLNGHVPEYWGEWNMSEKEAIQLARKTLDKLGYWKKPQFYNEKPENVRKLAKVGTHTIPHYDFIWRSTDGYAEVEVDAGTKAVKAFVVRSKSLSSRNGASSEKVDKP